MSQTTRRDRQGMPKVRAATPTNEDHVLGITWGDGSRARVDLTEPVFRLKRFRPLRNSERFKDVSVSDWGWAIAWGDDLDMSSETLWRLAQEQSRAEMTPGRFRTWLKARGLTQAAAAELLGISKRAVAYYATGAQPITRTIALAMKGAELELRDRIRTARKPAL